MEIQKKFLTAQKKGGFFGLKIKKKFKLKIFSS